MIAKGKYVNISIINKRFPMKNTETKGLIAGAFLIVFSLFMSMVPVFFSWDMMQAGYGTICISGFLFLGGLITFIMYIYRYHRLQNILKGEDVLVHWVYPKDKYLDEAKKNLVELKSRNKILLIIVWFFFILISALFVFIAFSEGNEDSLGFFLALMGSVLFIVTVVALISPYFQYRSAVNTLPEVIISKQGLFFMGQLHTWGPPMTILNDIVISKDKKELVFTIKYFTKLGWYKYEKYVVIVPIPSGENKKAQEVIDVLTK